MKKSKRNSKYYCFMCSSENYQNSQEERIKTPMGIILRDKNLNYSENNVLEIRRDMPIFFSGNILDQFPCLSYKDYKEKLKKNEKRPKCVKGNHLCNKCFSLYSVLLYLKCADNENLFNDKSIELFVKTFGVKNDVDFVFTPDINTPNRLFHNSINVSAMHMKNEKNKARRQFAKISKVVKDFLSFIVQSFSGYPLKFYFSADFDDSIGIGKKNPLCVEFSISSEGVITEKEVSNENIKELDISYVYDLWSLLTYVQFLGVRKILSPVIKICNISKFYEKKLLNDKLLLENGIVKCIKLGNVNGIIIEMKEILSSVVFNTDKLVEMCSMCYLKIENIKQNNINSIFKFKGRRNIQFKEVSNGFTFQKKQFEAVVMCNLPIGIGPDETPHSKDLKKNKYTAMINVLSLIDSNQAQSPKNSLLLYLLSYEGKLLREDFLNLFVKDSKWNNELKNIENSCFCRKIDRHIADTICNNFFFSNDILLIVRFHFHFSEDEVQFSMDQGEEKEKPPIIQTRISLDTRMSDRLSPFYKNPTEKLGKNTIIRQVTEMDLNLKFMQYLEGKRKHLPKSHKKAVYGSTHLYRGYNSYRSHVDHVVHEPKRIGGFDYRGIIDLFRKLVLPNIKEFSVRVECRIEFLNFLVNFGVVDRKLVTNKEKKLDWSKFIQKMESVLNISGDKRKIIIGKTSFSKSKYHGNFIANLINVCTLICEKGEVSDIYKECFFTWMEEYVGYFEGEKLIHTGLSSNLCNSFLIVKRLAKLIDKSGIFHQNIGLILKRFPRYCAYRFCWKSTLLDLFENGDTGSFGCSAKEFLMGIFRDLWERSPKFLDLAVRKIKYQMWNNSLDGSNDIEWIENDVYLNTLFCIVCHWMMRNEILRELYLNHKKIKSVVLVLNLKEVEAFFPDSGNFFIENVDNLVSYEIPAINNNVLVDEEIPEMKYLISYQKRLSDLRRTTYALIKEVKSRLNVVSLDWGSFTPEIRGLLKKNQAFQIEKWLSLFKSFEEKTQFWKNISISHVLPVNSFSVPNLFLTKLGLCLLWYMGKGKTITFIFFALCWINYMKKKFKFIRPRATVIFIIPKPLTPQMIGDIEDVILRFKLKSVLFFNISDVHSIKKLIFIVKSVQEKGGIIVGHSEKFIKIAKVCGLITNLNSEVQQDSCIQLDSSKFLDEESINLFKKVLFESEHTFVIIDEVSSVFQKNFTVLKSLFGSKNRKLVSTGTPIEKYGRVLFNTLDFVFGNLFTNTYRNDLERLIYILENTCNFEEIGELCRKIRILLFDKLKCFISIDMNVIARRIEYLIFFEPSDLTEDVLCDLESEILSRRIDHNYISMSSYFYEFISKKKQNNKRYTVKPKDVTAFLKEQFGEWKSKLNEKDILKLESGVSYFTWKFVKHQKSFNKKLIISSDFVNNLFLYAGIFAESKFKNIKNIKPYSGKVTSSKKKNEIIENFVESNEFEILLLSIGSGGYGLNLQRNCSDMLILALPWNYTKYIQLVTRIDRPPARDSDGQEEEKVFIKIPVMIDYSEEEIHLLHLQNLIVKMNVLDSIFGNKQDLLDKNESLNFEFSRSDLQRGIVKKNLVYSPDLIEDNYIKRYLDKINLNGDSKKWMKIKYCVPLSELVEFLNEKSKKRSREVSPTCNASHLKNKKNSKIRKENNK